jgi:putative SOS response-associated peptidase YedK
MPAVLREADHEAWLNGNPAEARAFLTPYPSDGMVAWQVGRRLYANKTPNDASLISPVVDSASET